MSRKIWLPKVLGYFMNVLILVAVLSILGLPWIVSNYVSYVYLITGSSFVRQYFLVVLYISGFLSLIVLYELRMIFASCAKSDPFIMRNVTSLKRIAYVALVIGGVFISKAIFFLTFLTLIVVFVFALAALFCFVLADVFEEAVNHKTEIDLTI